MNRSAWVLMHRKKCLLSKEETEKHFLEHVQVSFLIWMLQSTEELKRKRCSTLNTQVHEA